MDFVTVKVFDNPVEAHLLKTKLESEGIPCFLQDEHIVSLNPLYNYAVGGIKLVIHASDAEAASSIIKEIDNRPLLTEDNRQLVCPQCGSVELYANYKSMKGAKGFLSAILSFLMGVFPIYYRNVYKCKACENEFKADM
ncbi:MULTISPECIES: putative signal transducing protein [Olivibacter]|jgi:DNA-directed RNA polymerase subunit RPC12/RpoP|uniref:DUF2007 domain-containing protein n=2 Tax=Sphingobacteriaceae TaxID=84566 RepID=F4C1I0_SPHS2|nr:DUF2007 domain-containing protein [Olivibacter sp. UJ_SKK_5.1]MDX3916687.1 DUF2007 domain-containing protein [Pseudosphingobacterium sp.]